MLASRSERNQRVVITGGAGLIGRGLCRRSLTKGAEFVNIDSLAGGPRKDSQCSYSGEVTSWVDALRSGGPAAVFTDDLAAALLAELDVQDAGDVPHSCADVSPVRLLGYAPRVELHAGLRALLRGEG